MKRSIVGSVVLVVLAVAPAWAQAPVTNPRPATGCDGGYETDLIAGQHYKAGTVTACPNYEVTKLTVTYTTEPSWVITETHLAAGYAADVSTSDPQALRPQGIPMNKKGNPQNGKFPFGGTYKPGVTTVSFDVDLTVNGNSICRLNRPVVFLAAHAVVQGGNPGQAVSSQTAWGAGTPFNSDGWQTYFVWVPTCGSWSPE
jgi:hypothetical protein